METTQIIILAAGKGTRMKSDEPKALTLLKGKSFLARILDTVDSLNLPIPPVIVVGHKKEQIKAALGDDRIYAEQSAPLGTGHAVASARECIDAKCRSVLVLSSDQPFISADTIKSLLSLHAEKKPTITIATLTVPDFEEWRKELRHFGRIVRDVEGSVKGIVEFKDATEKEKNIKELNPAVYVFDSEWLWKNISQLKNENNKKEYYLTDLIKIAGDQNKRIEAVPLASMIEGFQPNTKEELKMLEKFAG